MSNPVPDIPKLLKENKQQEYHHMYNKLYMTTTQVKHYYNKSQIKKVV